MILAVTGGKGGVGKSTLSFELGAALDAVVVDADLGMADLPTGRGPDLHDVLAGRADPVEAVRGHPVRVLPCGRSLAGARAADVTALSDALAAVERARGDVVVDCPAGLRADAGVPLAAADACVLVVSPRAFALADAVRTRELARELDAGLAGVAVNRVVDDPPTEGIARVLGAPATSIPADPRLGRAVAENRPVATRTLDDGTADAARPDDETVAALRSLAADARRCRSRT